MIKINLFPAPCGPSRRSLRAVFFAFLFAFALLPAIAESAGLTEGLRKYEAGDYAGAIGEWQPLADQGNPDALFNLGQLYRMGRGVAADASRAAEYYRRAALAGHAGARGALATLYYFDDATRQKRGEAISLWRQAAAAGDAPSQYTLAILYFNGQDVPRDLMQAYAWALLAAETGMVEGQQAEQSIRKNLSPNQMQQAHVLKGALMLSPRVAQPTGMTAGISAGTRADTKADIEPESRPAATSVPPATPAPVASEPERPPVEEHVEVEAAPAPAEEAVALAEAAPEPEVIPAREETRPVREEPRSPAAISSPDNPPYDTWPPNTWSVQLGFYSERANAARAWDNVARSVEVLSPGTTSNIVTVDTGSARGIFYRLLAGPFYGRAGADALCDSLKAIDIDCVVRKP